MLSTMYFEPENPIVKPSQFTSELLDWSERESQVATALSFMAKTHGYKWVYLHEIEE